MKNHPAFQQLHRKHKLPDFVEAEIEKLASLRFEELYEEHPNDVSLSIALGRFVLALETYDPHGFKAWACYVSRHLSLIALGHIFNKSEDEDLKRSALKCYTLLGGKLFGLPEAVECPKTISKPDTGIQGIDEACLALFDHWLIVHNQKLIAHFIDLMEEFLEGQFVVPGSECRRRVFDWMINNAFHGAEWPKPGP